MNERERECERRVPLFWLSFQRLGRRASRSVQFIYSWPTPVSLTSLWEEWRGRHRARECVGLLVRIVYENTYVCITERHSRTCYWRINQTSRCAKERQQQEDSAALIINTIGIGGGLVLMEQSCNCFLIVNWNDALFWCCREKEYNCLVMFGCRIGIELHSFCRKTQRNVRCSCESYRQGCYIVANGVRSNVVWQYLCCRARRTDLGVSYGVRHRLHERKTQS